MLTIRLTRKGKKNQPFFRVVVIDRRRSASGGRAVEEVGYIDPLTKKKSLKKERILHWIKNGAQPSATVHNLLVSEKVIEAKKINKFNKTKRAKAEEVKAQEAAKVAAAAPAAAESSGEAKPAEAPVEAEKPAEPTPAPEAQKEEVKEPASAEGSGVAKEEKAT
jgi:small subunit ribosomal protein S16